MMDELLACFLKERKSRQLLITEYEEWLNNIERMSSEKLKHLITTNNFGYRQNIQNTINLELNNRISIANLEVDKVHIGKFLLCQVISRCVKLSPLFTLVEDPEGNVERIALYNWAEQSAIPVKDRKKVLSINEASEFLSIGTKLVIKNSYYQIASSFNAIINPNGPSTFIDFDAIIRSDNPNDVIIINQDNELLNNINWTNNLKQKMREVNKKSAVDDKILSVDDFRQSGNKYFVSNDYAAAVDEYSSGIKLDPNNATLLANRAEAYLRLNQFDKALNDVEIALMNEPDHLKAAFRKGKALCGLKRYQEAIVVLKDLDLKMQTNIDNSIASVKQSTKKLLKHVEMLDSESRYGKYDYIKIIDEFCEKVKINQENDDWVSGTGPRLDHADFLIGDIEVRPVKKKGRGWIAKRDIPEGTLLIASKAFEIVYGNEVPLSYRSIDFTSKTMITATHSELVARIAQKLIAEPNLCQEVYKLYAGPEIENLGENLVDVRKIEKIIKYNFFETKDQWGIMNSTKENSRLTKDSGAGLWIMPSFFNHSCVDTNVEQLIIGDMIFIRTCRPILSGKELVLSYCSPMDSYEERSNSIRLHGIKICSCRLCNLERSEPKKVKLRQAEILKTYENTLGPQVKTSLFSTGNFNSSLIKELIKLIDELKDLRKEHPDLEFQSFNIKADLAAAYVRDGDLRRSLPVSIEIYKFVKSAQVPQFASNAAYQVASRYARLDKMKEAKGWWDVALKELAEPIRGKFTEEGTKWRKEARYLAEKLSPKMVSGAKNKGLF